MVTTEHRPFPSPDEILAAQCLGLPRDWSCFDFSGCPHAVCTVLTNDTREIEVCDACGDTRSRCLHPSCTWDPSETLLRCDTCGMDCT